MQVPRAIALAALLSHIALAQVPPMPTLRRYCLTAPIVVAGKPACVIAVPEGAEWWRLGERIQDWIEELSGVAVPLNTGVHWTKTLDAEPNLVLLGHFDINPAIQSLYHQHYVFTDARYPGPNGYELRTVHDPKGQGKCHVYLGSSGLEGAEMAVGAFLPMLKGQADVRVPHTIKIVVNGAEPLRLGPGDIQKKVDACRGKQFRSVSGVLTGSGLAYHRTGDPARAEIFKQVVPIWADTFAKWKRVGDTRGAVEISLVWDLIEESSVFTDAERLAISEVMWQYANKCPGANQPIDVSPTPRGNNWNARNDWWVAHYWMKYCQIDVAGLHARSLNWFAAQKRWWKSKEDCPGYGSATIYDLLTYALSARDFEYFSTDKAKTMADYGMVITNNLGYASPFGDIGGMNRTYHWPEALEVTTWFYRDGRYRWFLDNVMGHVPAGSSTLVYNHYVTDQVPPEEPKDLLGVHVFPLEDWVYDHRQNVLGTAPSAANAFLNADPAPPRDRCFDKISFRHNFDPNGAYLLLGGISHGYHAHPDGNSVICFTDKGRHWLFDAGYFVPDTIEHNTIAIYRDGLFEPIPRLTSVEARADFGPVALTQTKLAHYNGADWRRNIVWVKGRFFLFIDEIEALEAGSFGLQCIWRVIGDVTLDRDRFTCTQGLDRFCLVNGNGSKLKLTTTTPYSRRRHAVVQMQAADLEPSETTAFSNIFYCPEGGVDFPNEVVSLTSNAVLVRLEGERHAYAGTGRVRIENGPAVDCAMFYATADELFLAGGRSFEWAGRVIRSDRPIDAHVDFARGRATVEADEACTLHLGGVAWRLNQGSQALDFAPTGAGSVEQRLTSHWEAASAAHEQRLAPRRTAGAKDGPTTLWTVENTTEQTRTLYRALDDGAEQINFAREGKATVWTPGNAGCRPRYATDGNRDTYSAVPSGARHTTDAPKDLGIEWPRPVRVSQVWIEHYNNQYRPAEDGQDLQYWDGEQWVSINDSIEGIDGPLWVHTFKPVETSRIRIFITKFNTSRTAIRELMVFAKPVRRVEETRTVGQQPSDLCLADLDRDGRAEAVIAVEEWIRVFGPKGQKLWEHELPNKARRTAAYDLDRDGVPEIVASCHDAKLYCFNATGEQLWAVDGPKDAYDATIEPKRGYFNVLKCDDIDGDGDGEIVAGSVNWFAYAFDHRGQVLWRHLNWAHPPLDVTTIDLDGTGKKASLIGTRYCAANLFSHEGKQIGSVSVGYHGCATAVAAADMDGNGKPELVAGSRVGSVECKEWQTGRSWSLFMGAEVTRALMADLVGDSNPELVVCSRNAYVLAIDSAGKIIWKQNAGDAVLDLAAADFNGNGHREIVAACEDGNVVIYSHQGRELARTALGAAIVRLSLGDVDGDKRPDLGAATVDGRVRIIRPGW